MRVEKEDIDGWELLDVSVSLELLSHLCPDDGDGHVERVHLLDFGSLDIQGQMVRLPVVQFVACVEDCIPL